MFSKLLVKNLYLISALILIGACSKKAVEVQSNPTAIPTVPPTQAPENKADEIDQAGGLEGLDSNLSLKNTIYDNFARDLSGGNIFRIDSKQTDQACRHAGGKYVAHYMECICPQPWHIFSTEDAGKCSKLKINLEGNCSSGLMNTYQELIKYKSFNQTKEIVNKCLIGLIKAEGLKINFEIGEKDQTEFENFLQAIDEYISDPKVSLNIAKVASQDKSDPLYKIEYYIKLDTSRAGRLGVFAHDFVSQEVLSEGKFLIVKEASEPRKLRSIFSFHENSMIQDELNRIEKKANLFSSNIVREIYKNHLDSIRKSTSITEFKKYYDSRIYGNCNNICLVINQRKNSKRPYFQKQVYLNGSIYNNFLIIPELGTKSPEWILQLSPSDTFLNGRHYKFGFQNDEIVQTTEIIGLKDQVVNPIYEVKLGNMSQYGSLIDQIEYKSNVENGVVICDEFESSIDTEEKRYVWDRIALGPHTIDNRSQCLSNAFNPSCLKNKSLFGWKSSESDGFSEKFSGIFELTYDGITFPSSYHAIGNAYTYLKTFENYLVNEEARIIPMSDCFWSHKNWAKTIKNHGVRIASFSQVTFASTDICSSLKISNEDGYGLSPDLLWVFASGNNAAEQKREKMLNLCPLTTATNQPIRNFIVVAGVLDSPSTIWRDEQTSSSGSNYGEFSADIAADVRSLASNAVGTSFAAPRVSAAAAIISKKFPELSIEQMRLAILLGAEVELSHLLPVRSGGVLNIDKALDVAKVIAENKSQDFRKKNIIEKYLNSTIEGLKDKLVLWEKTNLIMK